MIDQSPPPSRKSILQSSLRWWCDLSLFYSVSGYTSFTFLVFATVPLFRSSIPRTSPTLFKAKKRKVPLYLSAETSSPILFLGKFFFPSTRGQYQAFFIACVSPSTQFFFVSIQFPLYKNLSPGLPPWRTFPSPA